VVVRSVLASVAAAWFVFQAATFVAPGAFQAEWPFGFIEGDTAAVAVTSAARILAVGLALLAGALVDGREFVAMFRPAPPPVDSDDQPRA
jgi:hypothetical protein